MVGLRASMLGQNIRKQLTSPAMLLLAGGLGFAAGHLTKRQASMPSSTERRRGSHNTLFGRALKLIALARILSRAFPSAAMDPSDKERNRDSTKQQAAAPQPQKRNSCIAR